MLLVIFVSVIEFFTSLYFESNVTNEFGIFGRNIACELCVLLVGLEGVTFKEPLGLCATVLLTLEAVACAVVAVAGGRTHLNLAVSCLTPV